MRELMRFIHDHIPDVHFEVSLAVSRFGNPEPEVALRAAPTTPHRVLSGALQVLAGELNLKTAPSERWLIRVEPWNDHEGRVYLELESDTEAEASRGLALLREVVE